MCDDTLTYYTVIIISVHQVKQHTELKMLEILLPHENNLYLNDIDGIVYHFENYNGFKNFSWDTHIQNLFHKL